MRSDILLGSAGGVFAEEIVDYRLRIADLSQRIAEILGTSRIRSGKLDDEPPYVVRVFVTASGEPACSSAQLSAASSISSQAASDDGNAALARGRLTSRDAEPARSPDFATTQRSIESRRSCSVRKTERLEARMFGHMVGHNEASPP